MTFSFKSNYIRVSIKISARFILFVGWFCRLDERNQFKKPGIFVLYLQMFITHKTPENNILFKTSTWTLFLKY